jgi:hypothetical protein
MGNSEIALNRIPDRPSTIISTVIKSPDIRRKLYVVDTQVSAVRYEAIDRIRSLSPDNTLILLGEILDGIAGSGTIADKDPLTDTNQRNAGVTLLPYLNVTETYPGVINKQFVTAVNTLTKRISTGKDHEASERIDDMLDAGRILAPHFSNTPKDVQLMRESLEPLRLYITPDLDLDSPDQIEELITQMEKRKKVIVVDFKHHKKPGTERDDIRKVRETFTDNPGRRWTLKDFAYEADVHPEIALKYLAKLGF